MEELLVQEGIAENLRFMILEVVKQLENTQLALDNPEPKIIETVNSRDDYIDNLKSVIENKCFSAIYRHGGANRRRVDLLRATNTVVSNLERIGDFAVNIVGQLNYLKDPTFIQRYGYDKFFQNILSSLDITYTALIKQDMSLAFKICRSESTLDMLYKVQFDRIRNELRSGTETENLITSHLILRYLERMGDSLLNIGEAVIFASVGEKFKIRQYEALKETLMTSGMEVPISDVEFQSIWGTRSGCRIGRVSSAAKADDKRPANGVLFKEGNKKKLLQEKENIERWEMILPGLPPRVLAQQEEKEQASLLIEFLGGCTFQDVVLTADWDIVNNAFFLIEETLTHIWDSTKAFGPVDTSFVSQLKTRMDDVFRLYPYLHRPSGSVHNASFLSFDDLLQKVSALEKELPAPYSVFIHGDFNINNVVYDHERQQLHYIDLHRSKQADPLQDISVSIVSNFRLPFFEDDMRRRLNAVALGMYRFSKRYAVNNGDHNFDARLSLGLIRNFITSTRFELNPTFAEAMFLRGVYLMERLVDHAGKPWEDYKLREEIMVY